MVTNYLVRWMVYKNIDGHDNDGILILASWRTAFLNSGSAIFLPSPATKDCIWAGCAILLHYIQYPNEENQQNPRSPKKPTSNYPVEKPTNLTTKKD